MATNVLQRARESGRCAPSLLSRDWMTDGFGDQVRKLLDPAGFRLAAAAENGDAFMRVLQMNNLPDSPARKFILEQRRCILLAIVGTTPPSSPSVSRLLSQGYLSHVKVWLDDILTGSVGGYDLLLHLLSNIFALPVTKSVVKDSGMGKAVGTLEKHKFVVGTPNEASIKSRVQLIKEAWNKSVKALKGKDEPKAPPAKRPAPPPAAVPAKKPKVEEPPKKASSFSSLLKKVSASSSAPSAKVEEANRKQADVNATAIESKPTGNVKVEAPQNQSEGVSPSKRSSKRVKWADHFGGNLEVAQIVDTGELVEVATAPEDQNVSWTDRKRRDREREKELLKKAKRSKLLDEDEDEEFGIAAPVQARTTWHQPPPLPPIPNVEPPQVSSNEVSAQNERMKTVPPIRYSSAAEVPLTPAQLSAIEQALEMTAQSAAVVSTIPFLTPREEPAAPPAPSPAPYPSAPAPAAPNHMPPSAATPDFVQSLGLPMFLVGQDRNALDTLAKSPGLLATLVDANGMYDQQRLMTLVQTLSGPLGHSQAPPTQNFPPPQQQQFMPQQPQQPPPNHYGPPASQHQYVNQSAGDGNLHVAGFGPGTTQTDIINLFAPYVLVDEVVMKGTFAFVNTRDPPNAMMARDALNGALVGGLPIRISVADRKGMQGPGGSGPYGPSFRGTDRAPNHYGPSPNAQPPMPPSQPPPPQFGAPQRMPPPSPAMPSAASMKDDKGNPATKNLFVAGYGPGTTEQQLREVFSMHSTVVGVVLKGNFSFVNTADKMQAVQARENLKGTPLNGGNLRINFAKETGRLGTSFDLTYNQTSGPNAPKRGRGGGPPANNLSYYGRG